MMKNERRAGSRIGATIKVTLDCFYWAQEFLAYLVGRGGSSKTLVRYKPPDRLQFRPPLLCVKNALRFGKTWLKNSF